jgi:hypothetical protein
VSHDKEGISAVQLAKEIGVSYPTAQGYRSSGLVEVDEGYVGGEEHGEGRRGRGARAANQIRGPLRWSCALLANLATSQ